MSEELGRPLIIYETFQRSLQFLSFFHQKTRLAKLPNHMGLFRPLFIIEIYIDNFFTFLFETKGHITHLDYLKSHLSDYIPKFLKLRRSICVKLTYTKKSNVGEITPGVAKLPHVTVLKYQ